MFTENQAMYQNIGRQSTERCGYDTKTMTPQFEYTNTEYVPMLVTPVLQNLRWLPVKQQL